ncbi:MAG TPA: hypothetical protein VMW63_03535 [Methanoregulaceae archaeon]|nr:hypothetical protein [Methanoregulaceae archaeon]
MIEIIFRGHGGFFIIYAEYTEFVKMILKNSGAVYMNGLERISSVLVAIKRQEKRDFLFWGFILNHPLLFGLHQ